MKAKARTSREADIMSDLENMDVMLGNGEYSQIEREIDQMTGFSNMLNSEENRENNSMRSNYSQENELRNMSENRNNKSFPRDIDALSGDINSRISQEISSW